MSNTILTTASLTLAFFANSYAAAQSRDNYDRILNERNTLAKDYNYWFTQSQSVERFYNNTGDNRAYSDLVTLDRRLVSIDIRIGQLDRVLDRIEIEASALSPPQKPATPTVQPPPNESALIRLLNENANRYVPTPGEGPTMVAPSRAESLRGGR